MAEDKLADGKSSAITNVITNWAAKDLPSASHWVLSQPSGKLRDELIQQIAMKRAELDPRQAARLVLEEIPAGDTQYEAVISVLHQWALRDMVSAKAWVEIFPSGSTIKERALRDLTNLDTYR